MAWGLGYFGMPHILLRFMAIEDENKLKISRRVATVWVVISLTIGVFIGIVGYSMSKAGDSGDYRRTDSCRYARGNNVYGRFTAFGGGFRSITESCKRLFPY